MARRRRGIKHMIKINDKTLQACQPNNTPWEEYVIDCENAVNTPDLHSDEYSTEDEALASEERVNNNRPARNTGNSVIKVYDKNWRSKRVCKV